MVELSSDSPIPEITLVTSPGCHMCEMAKDSIAAIADDHPVNLRLVELASTEGRELSERHRMPFPPLLLIDGRYHGHGRVSEKKLRRALAATVLEYAKGTTQHG